MDASLDKLKGEFDRPTIKEVDPRAGMVAVMVVVIMAAGVGFVIYRRRRRVSLRSRFQRSLPDVDDIRASIKKPLERVVKAL
jgi:hypothetical protein